MPITAPAPEKKNGETPRVVAANPFVRAATAVTEGAFHDKTSTLSASSSTQVSDQDVPAFGYLRAILLRVTASGGSGSGTPAVADEDAPFNVLADVTLNDVNGRSLIGPLSGFDLYLANKWGGYAYAVDAKSAPGYSAPATSGDFDFILRLPVEVSLRDGLGALPNQNSSATYKLGYSIAAASTVYSTQPAPTLPSVRVRAYAEFWSPVEPVDPAGMPNMTEPPAVGTTQHWTKSTPTVTASSENRIRLTRVGNMIRTLIFILRNSSGDRVTTSFPDALRLEWDGRNEHVFSRDIVRHHMWEQSLITPDTGVLVLSYAADLDGKIGMEMRDQWKPSTEATRLELVGTFGASASSLQVLTNDVAPRGSVHV